MGAILFAGGLIVSNWATAQWHLYLWYGVVASIGITILGLSNYATLISHWFRQKRGLALGIAFAGTGAGTFLIIPLTEYWVSIWGWQRAMIAQGGLLLVLVLPLSFFLLRLRPSDMGVYPDGEPIVDRYISRPSVTTGTLIHYTSTEIDWTLETARSTRAFWLILISGWGALFSLRMLTVHQVAVVVDAGINRFTAATIMGGSGVVTVIAFVFWGAISDRLGRRRTFILSSFSLILAFLILLYIQGPQDLLLLYMYALMVGLGEGSRSSLVTAIMNDTFPGKATGQITGYVGMSFGAGAALGSWVAGMLFDLMGSYNLALWFGLVVTILSASCMAMVSWLVRQNREYDKVFISNKYI